MKKIIGLIAAVLVFGALGFVASSSDYATKIVIVEPHHMLKDVPD